MNTSKQALASFLGWDLPELKDYRYHAGRTSIPVYTCDNFYYCATKGNQKPAKYTRIVYKLIGLAYLEGNMINSHFK